VVFLSDCRYDDIYHDPRRLTAGRILPLYERLLSLGAEVYLGGHEPEPITRTALEAEEALVRRIAATVERVGIDRAAVLAALRQEMGSELDEDAIEIADALMTGAHGG